MKMKLMRFLTVLWLAVLAFTGGAAMGQTPTYICYDWTDESSIDTLFAHWHNASMMEKIIATPYSNADQNHGQPMTFTDTTNFWEEGWTTLGHDRQWLGLSHGHLHLIRQDYIIYPTNALPYVGPTYIIATDCHGQQWVQEFASSPHRPYGAVSLTSPSGSYDYKTHISDSQAYDISDWKLVSVQKAAAKFSDGGSRAMVQPWRFNVQGGSLDGYSPYDPSPSGCSPQSWWDSFNERTGQLEDSILKDLDFKPSIGPAPVLPASYYSGYVHSRENGGVKFSIPASAHESTSSGTLPISLISYDVNLLSHTAAIAGIYPNPAYNGTDGTHSIAEPSSDGLSAIQFSSGGSNSVSYHLIYKKSVTVPAGSMKFVGIPFHPITGTTVQGMFQDQIKNGVELLVWGGSSYPYLTNTFVGSTNWWKEYAVTGVPAWVSNGITSISWGDAVCVVNKRSTNITLSLLGAPSIGTNVIRFGTEKTLMCYPYPVATDLKTNGLPFAYGDQLAIQGSSGWVNYYLDDLDLCWYPSDPPALAEGQAFFITKVAVTNWIMTPPQLTIPATVTVKGDYANSGATNYYGITCTHGLTHSWGNFYDRTVICSGDIVHAYNTTGTGTNAQTRVIVSASPSTTLGKSTQNATQAVNFYAGSRKGATVTAGGTPFGLTISDPPNNNQTPAQPAQIVPEQ